MIVRAVGWLEGRKLYKAANGLPDCRKVKCLPDAGSLSRRVLSNRQDRASELRSGQTGVLPKCDHQNLTRHEHASPGWKRPHEQIYRDDLPTLIFENLFDLTDLLLDFPANFLVGALVLQSGIV